MRWILLQPILDCINSSPWLLSSTCETAVALVILNRYQRCPGAQLAACAMTARPWSSVHSKLPSPWFRASHEPGAGVKSSLEAFTRSIALHLVFS